MTAPNGAQPTAGGQVGPDVGLFLSLLRKRDLKQARTLLEDRAQMVAGEFGRGFLCALEGMVSAVEGGQTFSPIWKLLENEPDREFLSRLEEDIRDHLSKPFVSDRERGYFTAWLSLIRLAKSS